MTGDARAPGDPLGSLFAQIRDAVDDPGADPGTDKITRAHDRFVNAAMFRPGLADIHGVK